MNCCYQQYPINPRIPSTSHASYNLITSQHMENNFVPVHQVSTTPLFFNECDMPRMLQVYHPQLHNSHHNIPNLHLTSSLSEYSTRQISRPHNQFYDPSTKLQRKKQHRYRSTTRTLKEIPIENDRHNIKIALFNAHSTQNKLKRSAITEFIKDEKIDVMFVTETWLQPSGDENKIKHLTPPGYKLFSLPRGTLGGGILVIYRDHLPVKISTTFPFNHKSFELLHLSITSPKHFHLFCLYKTPPRKKNGLKNSDFVNELPDFLEHINLLCGSS